MLDAKVFLKSNIFYLINTLFLIFIKFLLSISNLLVLHQKFDFLNHLIFLLTLKINWINLL